MRKIFKISIAGMALLAMASIITLGFIIYSYSRVDIARYESPIKYVGPFGDIFKYERMKMIIGDYYSGVYTRGVVGDYSRKGNVPTYLDEEFVGAVSSYSCEGRISKIYAYCDEGVDNYWKNNYKTALVSFEKGLEMSRSLGHEHATRMFLFNIGQVYMALEQYDKALSYHEEALEIAKEIVAKAFEEKRTELIRNLYDVLDEGVEYYLDSNYEAAIESFEKGLEISHMLNSGSLEKLMAEQVFLFNIGQVYAALEQNEKAVIYHDQAYGIEGITGIRTIKDGTKEIIINLYIDTGYSGEYTIVQFLDTAGNFYDYVKNNYNINGSITTDIDFFNCMICDQEEFYLFGVKNSLIIVGGLNYMP